MPSKSRRVRRSFLLLVSGLVLGCGGMAPPPEAPAPGSEPAGAQAPTEETQSLEPAPAAPAPSPPRVVTEDSLVVDEELARAERELAAADAELSGAAAKRSSEESEQPAQAPGGQGAAAKPKSSSAQNTCATTCRAFASLLRARDAICRIDGEYGDRCTHANQIVERHTERTASCGCSG